MNCTHFDQLLDGLLDGELGAGEEQALRRHAAHCGRCGPRLAREETLQAALRSLPVPPPSPGFAERALGRAREQARAPRSRAPLAAGLGLAASLALGIGLGVSLVGPGPDESALPQVALSEAAAEPQTVRLLYTAERPLEGVTLTLRLPPQVALAGFEGRRELVWQTDLRAGRNLLSLPLVARRAGSGYLETELAHGEQRKRFRVELVVHPRSAPGAPGDESDSNGVISL